jgi:SAM-dependent methyltransferase
MNREHLEGLRSDAWASFLESDLLPWVLDDDADLGARVVEIGPGPGRTTDILQTRFDDLSAVEIDEALAAELRDRFASRPGVSVHHGDGAAMPFADGTFTGACCFIMLHHVPTPDHQDRLFGEVARVLGPNGTFVGADAISSDDLASRHVDDTFNPIDPSTLAARLQDAGFTDVVVTERTGLFKFRARTPA